jgi:diguanylate cyclase (GGDEF)-like protein
MDTASPGDARDFGHAMVKKWSRNAARLVRPRHWSLWTISRPFAAYVLAVDAAAVAVVGSTVAIVPITGRHLAWFIALAVLSALHVEATRRIERMRELATDGQSYTNLTAIWTFAGLLLLPPPLVAALIVIVYVNLLLRIRSRGVVHAWVWTAASTILASAAAGAILATAASTYPGWPGGWVGIGIVAVAAVVRWLVNSLNLLVYWALTPSVGWRQASKLVFGNPSDDLIEFTTLSLGAAVAVLFVADAPALLVLILPLVVVHRGLQLSQFRTAAQRDPETGVLRLEWWLELGNKLLERAERFGGTAGYLVVRLDEPNARLADVPERRIVRLVAEAVGSQVRENGLVGRLPGGSDFAVLVADVSYEDLGRLASRIQDAVRAINVAVETPDGTTTVSGLTVSIGGAGYPNPANELNQLMLCGDNALFAARSYIRDEVRIVAPDDPAVATR